MTRLRSRSRRPNLLHLRHHLRPLLSLILVLAVISLLICRAFFGYMVRAQGDTMAPAIEPDTWLWVSFDDPSAGQIVLVDGEDSRTLRRVIGVPGDTISINGDRILRNGTLMNTAQLNGTFDEESSASTPQSSSPITDDVIVVTEGSFYLHCDQLWLCRDAEHTGLVEGELVVGPISELWGSN